MKNTLYMITPTITMDSASVFVIMVNGDPFCYVGTKEEMRPMMEEVATALHKELLQEDNVKHGKVHLFYDSHKDHEIVISKQLIGYWRNGAKTPVYTITSMEVSHGFVQKHEEVHEECTLNFDTDRQIDAIIADMDRKFAQM